MRTRGALVAYLFVMAALWWGVFGLSAIGGDWDRGGTFVFAMFGVGVTVAVYLAWRVVVLVGAGIGRVGAVSIRLSVRAGNWLTR